MFDRALLGDAEGHFIDATGCSCDLPEAWCKLTARRYFGPEEDTASHESARPRCLAIPRTCTASKKREQQRSNKRSSQLPDLARILARQSHQPRTRRARPCGRGFDREPSAKKGAKQLADFLIFSSAGKPPAIAAPGLAPALLLRFVPRRSGPARCLAFGCGGWC